MGVARPAHAGVQVVLQVRVAARNARDPLDRRGRKRRSAQVRVHDDAGGVERRAQARRSVELPLGPCEELLGSLGDASPAGIGERRPDRLDGGRAPVARDEVGGALVAEHGVDGRQSSQRVIGHGAILCPHVPRQRRPTLYAMQSFGRRQRPRRLPPVRPLAAIAVVVASALLATAAFVTHRLWPLTDRAAGAIDAPGLRPGRAAAPGTPAPVNLVAGDAAGSPANVHARAAIVVDRTTGRVLWQKDAHRPLPVASLTKLMTALVAADGKLDASFRVTPPMTGVPGYTLGLHTGDRVTERRMLAAALIASANDAANALAVHRSGSVARFVRRMNAQARDLGLADTHYSNPSGIYDRATARRRGIRRPSRYASSSSPCSGGWSA